MKTGVSHDELERELKTALEAYDSGVDWRTDNRSGIPINVDIEVEPRQQYERLPSGKSAIEPDVLFTSDMNRIAFEVKTSKSDLVNWFVQRRDYEFVGMTPVLAIPHKLAYQAAPYQRRTLRPHYVTYDVSTSRWSWHADLGLADIEQYFDGNREVVEIDACPECGAWVSLSGRRFGCAACDWYSQIHELEASL